MLTLRGCNGHRVSLPRLCAGLSPRTTQLHVAAALCSARRAWCSVEKQSRWRMLRQRLPSARHERRSTTTLAETNDDGSSAAW